jgi:transcriptional regulator with XRE-family HTH domain
LIKKSDLPQAALAIRFGVTQSNISQIKRGHSWVEIEAAA